ncbi:hypothetical protein GIB67_015609 [Kingdonia uniflora]|uniref:Uncharacterized protein n=1 Tax=Kingdonia uniflora TaxID=39325 RepID=A0A7J7NTX8_9MAGN|nr:hypothetical protein GIB67_015609 [Kingdonia uniflora]
MVYLLLEILYGLQIPMLELNIHGKVRSFLLMMSLSIQKESLLLVVLLVPLCLKLVYELNQRGKY